MNALRRKGRKASIFRFFEEEEGIKFSLSEAHIENREKASMDFDWLFLMRIDFDSRIFLPNVIRLQELALDYFVEDNWDVVNYLAKEQGQTQIWWLSNFLDRQIDYPHKFFSFQSVVSKIAGFLL